MSVSLSRLGAVAGPDTRDPSRPASQDALWRKLGEELGRHAAVPWTMVSPDCILQSVRGKTGTEGDAAITNDTARSAPRKDVPRRSARILVVDDIEDNRDLLVRRLQREGYHDTQVAADGEAALKLIAAQSFDLVLLDVMMPICNGYEVLERLNAVNRLHELPVIVISALNELDSAVRCIQLGAVDYLTKPFNPTLLRARVNATIEQKRLRDAVRAHLARIEAELETARKLQAGMVPTLFPTPTPARPVEIHAMMDPAREVGGDLYDFFFAEDGRLVFFIGDVSGKGVPAAMFMAQTKNLLRMVTGFLLRDGRDAATPAAVLRRVNQELCEGNGMMMFVTGFFGMLDVQTGDLQFSCAGHEAPYLIGADGLSTVAGAQGLVLGLNADWAYKTASIRLAPGDALYLYTDGITEAFNSANVAFSRHRLEDALRRGVGQSIDQLVQGIVAAVRDFTGDAPQSDDITCLAIRRLPLAAN
jgi:sigma-B regulation protein RsbU (phosphoserine phosphatase)